MDGPQVCISLLTNLGRHPIGKPFFNFNIFVFVRARNLDEATKSVYKENVRITKALNYHTEEGEQLRKLKERLERENDQLKGDKEIDDLLIQRKVAQARHNKRLVKEVCPCSYPFHSTPHFCYNVEILF